MTSKKKVDVKIGTEEEVMWTDFKKKIQFSQETLKKEVTINKGILELCEQKLKDCKLKEKPPIGVG